MGYSPADQTHVMIVAGRSGHPAYRKLLWRCAGCQDIHAIHAHSHGEPIDNEPSWRWNGSMTAPTFEPSILKAPGAGPRCHSFVRDGVVQFLGDSDHALAGQSVRMVPENADPFRAFGKTRDDPDDEA